MPVVRKFINKYPEIKGCDTSRLRLNVPAQINIILNVFVKDDAIELTLASSHMDLSKTAIMVTGRLGLVAVPVTVTVHTLGAGGVASISATLTEIRPDGNTAVYDSQVLSFNVSESGVLPSIVGASVTELASATPTPIEIGVQVRGAEYVARLMLASLDMTLSDDTFDITGLVGEVAVPVTVTANPAVGVTIVSMNARVYEISPDGAAVLRDNEEIAFNVEPGD